MKTSERLVEAAAALLDEGGESAVTLRAVAAAVGVTQNAPYKHFQDRRALLAAVAVRDFRALSSAYAEIRRTDATPRERLRQVLQGFVDYGQKHPARYRLFFSDPEIAAQEGELRQAAMASFKEVAAAVEDCQRSGDLPPGQTAEFTGLIFATVHGLLDLQAGGRMRSEKGLTSVMASVDLLLGALSNNRPV